MPSFRHRGSKAAVLTLLIVSGYFSNVQSEYTDVYNVPMVGILAYKGANPPYSYVTYGTVTIAHSKMVIAAVENLCQLDPGNSKFIFREDIRRNLYVIAGSDLMSPPDSYERNKLQRVNVDLIYVGKSSKFMAKLDEAATSNRKTWAKAWEDILQPVPSLQGTHLQDLASTGYEFNPFGELQWDVALITLQTALVWGPYVLPIPNLNWHVEGSKNFLKEHFKKAWDLITFVEEAPHEFQPCFVPGWSPIGNNEIIYHRVIYVRFKECAQAICGAYPSACLKYLNPRHHVCFKSLTFADSCVLDQGAPVVCKWAKNFTLAVLVKTWDCGTGGLPTVFTRVDSIAAFAAILNDDALSVKEPYINDPKYTLKPLM